MGPSFDLLRADEVQVGTAIVASTRTGEPYEPARGWSDVIATEHVVATEIVTSSAGTSLVKIDAVRKTVGGPEERVTRFFPPGQILQEVL